MKTINKKLCILNDRLGNAYLGIKVYQYEISEFSDMLQAYLGDEYELFANNRISRDGINYHITVLNVMEFQPIKDKAIGLVDTEVYLNLMGIGKGEGKGNTTYFVIVESEELDYLYNSLYDKKKDFHITLGFDKKDVFGVSKGLDTKIETKKALI
jgi:hypothetical protein